jgi:hypothetical protein
MKMCSSETITESILIHEIPGWESLNILPEIGTSS